MDTRIMSEKTIARLQSMGWEFMPYGPNEWQWLKFAGHKRIASQCDATWNVDLARAEASA